MIFLYFCYIRDVTVGHSEKGFADSLAKQVVEKSSNLMTIILFCGWVSGINLVYLLAGCL